MYYSQYYNESFEDGCYFSVTDHHNQMYSDYPTTSEYFINNSNLVEITQQKRERQRIESNQITVQVGNVLEIVPSSDFNLKPLSESNNSHELKLKRHEIREKKRKAKLLRKENIRKEIQRLLDAGIAFDDSDEELFFEPTKLLSSFSTSSILKTSNVKNPNVKRVKYGDGLFPHESSEIDENQEAERSYKMKLMRRRARLRRRGHILQVAESDGDSIFKKENLISPPSPPKDHPPKHLKQPILKKITPDLFASFSINPEPIYFYLQKLQMNGHHHQQPKASRYKQQKTA